MAVTYKEVELNTDGGVYSQQEWEQLDSTRASYAGEGYDRLNEGYGYYKASADYQISPQYQKDATDEYDAAFETARTSSGYETAATVAKETVEAAADFRKDAYESYRNKYTQHAGTALGTSTGSNSVVIG